MTRNKLIIVLMFLLLVSGGIAIAQSSPNFVTQRFALYSGSSAESTSFAVTGVIGQPATGSNDSANFAANGGFLHPAGPSLNYQIWLPIVMQ